MRKFICSPFGEEVDLDDPRTYDHLPKNTKDLRNRMFENIGYAYCYMNFYRKDIYSGNGNDLFDICIQQKNRIDTLIKYFAENEKDNRDNIQWYQEQIFLFEDETENMV